MMKDYVIFTDSTCDLNSNQVKDYGVEVVPMEFTMDSKSYIYHPENQEMQMKDFYNKLREGKTANTSQITAITFTEFFEHSIKKGKDILYIGFPAELSGTFNNALVAAKELMEKYPDSKIEIIDSGAASMGLGLLVYHSVMKKREGLSLEENRDFVIQTRDHLCHWFTVDDLNYLKRGGRISTTKAIFGTVMSIKPIIHIDNCGRLIPVDKIRGRRQAIENLFGHMVAKSIDPKNQKIFICHGDAEKDANFLAELIRKELKVKDIEIGYMGPIIGSHTGPGALGLLFLGSEK